MAYAAAVVTGRTLDNAAVWKVDYAAALALEDIGYDAVTEKDFAENPIMEIALRMTRAHANMRRMFPDGVFGWLQLSDDLSWLERRGKLESGADTEPYVVLAATGLFDTFFLMTRSQPTRCHGSRAVRGAVALDMLKLAITSSDLRDQPWTIKAIKNAGEPACAKRRLGAP